MNNKLYQKHISIHNKLNIKKLTQNINNQNMLHGNIILSPKTQ